jgi:hypothetical protein
MDIGCLFWCFSLVFGVEALGKGLVWQVIEIHSRWNCVGPSKLCGHYAIEFPIKIWTAIFFLLFSSKLLEIKKIIIDWVNLEHVCFLKSSFQKIIFQTFLYLFIIKKIGQRKTLFGLGKTLSSQRKHFPIKEKFGLIFRKVFFILAVFVFRKMIFEKSLSKFSCVCLSLEKLVNGKHFSVKGKFGLVFRKVFSWKIWTENTFRKLWKI